MIPKTNFLTSMLFYFSEKSNSNSNTFTAQSESTRQYRKQREKERKPLIKKEHFWTQHKRRGIKIPVVFFF